MRNIRIDASLLTFLDELEFTDAALSANADAADLAKPVADKIAEWDGIFRQERAARRTVTRADAVVAVRDDGLDTLTKKVAALAFVEANQDRKSAFFRRLFPTAPSDFMGQGLRKQCQLTIDSLIPEMKKLNDASQVKALADPLSAASKAAIDALDARSKAMGERGIGANDVQEWKEGVNRLRATTYAELFKRAADKGYGKAWADTFFRKASAPDQADDPEPTPVDPVKPQ